MLARTNWNKRKAAARLQISYKALLLRSGLRRLTIRGSPRERAGEPGALALIVADGSVGV
jgi:hypothetical protein